MSNINNRHIISIILPIYNCERFLSRCLESVISQTYGNWELILVNDGSDDYSKQICLEYVNRYQNVKYYEQSNSGVSKARNVGIYHASGDFITFLDSDDWFKPNAIELMTKAINNLDADLLQFSAYKVDKNLQETPFLLTSVDLCSPEEFAKNEILVSVWGTVVRTEIIISNNLKFDENMKIAEDQLFVFDSIKNSSKCVKFPDCIYCYYSNIDSVMHNLKTDYVDMAYNKLIKYRADNPIFRFQLTRMLIYYIRYMIYSGATSYNIIKKRYADVSPNYLELSNNGKDSFVILSAMPFPLMFFFTKLYYLLTSTLQDLKNYCFKIIGINE